MLQADAPDNKEILNSAGAVENGVLLNRIINSDAPAAKALTAGSDWANTYTLENATDQEQTYTVTLATTGRTPADWSAQFASGATNLTASGTQPAGGQIIVPARATAQLSLTLKTGAALGLGDAKVVLELQGTPTVKRSRMVSGISREIKHLLLETGSEYSLRPYLANTACADAVTLDPGDYLTFANELTDVNMVIWNKGPAGGLSAEEMKVIKSAKNVNTFLCGDNLVGSLTPADLGYFGLEWIGWNLEGVAPTYTVWLSGQDGDVITGNLGGSIEARLISYYVNMVRISDTQNVFPIMHFQKDGRRRFGNATYNIPAQDTIFGVRSTKNNTRTVFLGISPYVIANQQTRRTLVSDIVNWLAQ